MMARSAEIPDAPIHATIEHDRLVHRERRLRRVVSELRARASAGRRDSGTVPVPLRHAIADFETELRAVQRTLRHRG